EALARAPAEAQAHGPGRQPGVAVTLRETPRDPGADRQVVVADVVHPGEWAARCETRLERAQDFLVERLDAGAVVPRDGASPRSVRTSMRCRKPFSISSACVSASPSSQGEPACLIEDSGDAPVPPLWPEMST